MNIRFNAGEGTHYEHPSTDSSPAVMTVHQTILNQAAQNGVAATGAALGLSILDPILPFLFRHQVMRVPLAQFSSQLEAVLLRNSALSAPQLVAFAENAVALLRSVLPVVKELQITLATQMPDFFQQIQRSFLPLSGFIELPDAKSLGESGDILAGLITGAACRQAPLSQILKSAGFAEVLSTFSLAAAVPFTGSAAVPTNCVHSAAFTGALLMSFMTRLPEFLMKSNLDGSRLDDLIEALPAHWFLLSFTVTTVTMSLMIAVSRNAIEIDQSVDSEISTTDKAMSELISKTVTNCEQMITAAAQATEAGGLRSVLHQNGFLPAVDPKIATGMQGIMQRILGIIGKITEDSRRLLLLTEGI